MPTVQHGTFLTAPQTIILDFVPREHQLLLRSYSKKVKSESGPRNAPHQLPSLHPAKPNSHTHTQKKPQKTLPHRNGKSDLSWSFFSSFISRWNEWIRHGGGPFSLVDSELSLAVRKRGISSCHLHLILALLVLFLHGLIFQKQLGCLSFSTAQFNIVVCFFYSIVLLFRLKAIFANLISIIYQMFYWWRKINEATMRQPIVSISLTIGLWYVGRLYSDVYGCLLSHSLNTSCIHFDVSSVLITLFLGFTRHLKQFPKCFPRPPAPSHYQLISHSSIISLGWREQSAPLLHALNYWAAHIIPWLILIIAAITF